MEYISSEWIWPAWLCWIIPLIGAGLTPILAKIQSKVRDYLSVGFTMLSAFMTILLIPSIFSGMKFHNQIGWILVPGASILEEIKLGVMIDPLSVIMANIVAIIGSLIMIYSLGYMKGDPDLTRYWFFMNLFIGDMLLLVMSDNFIQFLIGWEGVGLCSYALIGFWYRDAKKDYLKCWVGEGARAYPPSYCGLKAFITTRVGDVSMLIGLFLILSYAGTLNFLELSGEAILKVPLWVLIPAAILLFGGPMGKSAQLPLMEWLPDAMTGPTTVSALIHAATMVKAGVYLIGRVFPILYVATWHSGSPNELINFFYTVAWIGVITAFIAGTQAMASNEIKKVLAYSTVSQLGYMMVALGVAGSSAEFLLGYTAGVFHMMSHALFKAALFLAAGAVIHSTHSRFMYHMGGIRKYMPITFWSMTLAAFSLMGVPLLFSGFWSKDMVLEASLVSGQYLIFILAVITVALTAFYSIRMLGLTFTGKKSSHLEKLEAENFHVHEAAPILWIPYTILTALTILFGVIGSPLKGWLEGAFDGFLHSLVPIEAAGSPLTHGGGESVWITTSLSIIMLVVGAIPAWMIYFKKDSSLAGFVSRSEGVKSLSKFIYNRWYINRFYNAVFVSSIIGFCKWALQYIETIGIDGFNYLLSKGGQGFSNWFRRSHTGILMYNIIGMMVGGLIMVILVLRVALG